MSSSVEELIHANQRLQNLIATMESISKHNDSSTSVETYSAIVLGRRIASTSIPPSFIRFNPDSGPLDPIPNQFQVPFPSVENLRMSYMNSKMSTNRAVVPPHISKVVNVSHKSIEKTGETNLVSNKNESPKSKPEEDEYAEDF